MGKIIKIGIIICNRYGNCGGGKCFRALSNREGAFDIYSKEDKVEIVGFANCGGCPGGNIEYVPEEMKKNGAEVIHLATGMVVGYPPCPRIKQFQDFIREKYNLDVVIGTHPIPQKYFETHSNLGTWESNYWKTMIEPTLDSERIRLLYN